MARETSTAVAIRETCATIASPEFRAKIDAALSGTSVQQERYTRLALQAIQQNPSLIECDRGSLFNSVLKCAADGLVPDGREAAFVPYKVKGRLVCQYLPMIFGLRKKAAEHGVQISAYCVYEHDQFRYRLGTDPLIEHVPARLGSDRGELLGAYSVATDRDGMRYVEVMGRGEIEQIRERSRAKDAGPWVTDFDEMARKTVARRNFKQVPLLVERMPSVVAALDSAIAVETPFDRTLTTAPAAPELVAADAAFEDPAPGDTSDPDDPSGASPEGNDGGTGAGDTVDAEVVSDEDASYFQARLAEVQDT